MSENKELVELINKVPLVVRAQPDTVWPYLALIKQRVDSVNNTKVFEYVEPVAALLCGSSFLRSQVSGQDLAAFDRVVGQAFQIMKTIHNRNPETQRIASIIQTTPL
jgi:hypothetical protein